MKQQNAEKRDAANNIVGYLKQHGEEDAAELVLEYADEQWPNY